MYLQGDLGWMGGEWVWLRGDAHWLGGPRVQHPIGQSSVTWSLPHAWIPKCGLRLRRSVKAVGRPALCVLPHLCVRGQVPVGLALGNADSRPPGGRILQSSCAVLSACALFFSFLHRYRKWHQFRGVPPTSQNQRSHHQWPDCET